MSIQELSSMPPVGPLYRRAALAVVPGIGRARRAADVPVGELVVRGVPVDRDNLADYDRVCGFPVRDTLPATYPHIMGFPLAIRLMSAPDFPIQLVGIVHVHNRITMHRPIDADERLDFTARAGHLRPHPRGRQLDVDLAASVGGVEVWRGVSTYLSKERRSANGERSGSDSGSPSAGARPAAGTAAAIWRVQRRVGTDYARVSGDHNPIHTSRLGARLFGFPQPIAHGMWSTARCLAALDNRLPDSYTVDVAFKLPLPLPSTVAFTAAPSWTFALHSARSGKPHLTGEIS
jgi:MaoC like domain